MVPDTEERRLPRREAAAERYPFPSPARLVSARQYATTVKPADPSAQTRGVRADIQSLRALAVGLVVLNHLWPGDLPGGYIGVDIFFVISGYLITSHLVREVNATGGVKLGSFWARRAKRLLPAALVVLIASGIIALTLVPLLYQQSALRQIAAAGAYFLNWLLFAESADYFAQTDALSPVTHYWSLSVEEQFYVVWPLVILGVLLLTKATPARVRKTALVVAMTLILVASLAWAIFSTARGAAGAYFATTGRAWEFAAGALLAFAPSLPSIDRRAAAATSWLMWGALVGCAFLYSPASGFPGPLALVPVTATAALLWLRTDDCKWAPQRVLAIRPVTFVGDISYSLYLWHWPLIVAVTYALGGTLSGGVKAGIVIGAVLLAWLTKRLVEDPVRLTKLSGLARPRNVLIATAASIALLWGGTLMVAPDVEGRAEAAVAELNADVRQDTPCFGARAAFADCEDSHTLGDLDYALNSWELLDRTVSNGTYCSYKWGAAELAPCSFGVPEGSQRRDVALVGDSHAAMMVFPLDAVSAAHGLRVHTYLAEACAALDDDSIAVAGSTEQQRSDQCNAWRVKVIDELTESPLIDTIVTTSFDTAYYETANPSVRDSGDGYVRAWEEWLLAGKTVIVINDVPRFPQSVPECIMSASTLEDPCAMDADALSTEGPLWTAAQQIDDPDFHFVDHRDVYCDDQKCHTVIGGIPVYIDSNHLTSVFARSFGEFMFPAEAFEG